MDILTKEITSKKVRGSNVGFSTIEITSKKVRGNNVDFSTKEITSKNYVETTWIFRPVKLHRKSTWKFVKRWSSTYRRNFHVESTPIGRGVLVET